MADQMRGLLLLALDVNSGGHIWQLGSSYASYNNKNNNNRSVGYIIISTILISGLVEYLNGLWLINAII